MDKQFWIIIGGVFGFAIVLWVVLFLIVSYALKDVTIDGLAESAGQTMTQIEDAYERGKQGQ